MIPPSCSKQSAGIPRRLRRGRLCSLIFGLVVVTMAFALATACAEPEQPAPVNNGSTANKSPEYLAGQKLFAANCAQCHGENAAGTDLGPPLIHQVYEPNHHPDFAFHAAVNRGVRQHHWYFGDMAPLPHLTEPEVDQIICYIRTLQRDAGISVQTSC